ncbi:MAG: YfiR family protein [Ginsengibacter sp.]
MKNKVVALVFFLSVPLFLFAQNDSVPTISEQPGFAEQGTAFNFVVKRNRLKFEANLKSISSAGLKAGSQLLKLAIIVD